MNTINNNKRKDDFKKKNFEISDVDHSYIGDKCKNWIDNVFKSNLRDGDLHLTESDNKIFSQTNVVNNHLEKKILMRCA